MRPEHTVFVALAASCAPHVVTEPGYALKLHDEDLSAVPEVELAAKIQGDAVALRRIADGVQGLERQAVAFIAELDQRGGRQYNTPDEDDKTRALLLTYLNYRSALFRILAYHSSYEKVPREDQRLKSFLVGYASALTLFREAVLFVELFKDKPHSRRKLNEAEPVWGIPPKMYDTIYGNITHPGNVRLLAQASDYYDQQLPRVRQLGLLGDERWAWLPEVVDGHRRYIQERSPSVWAATWEKLGLQMRESGYSIVYDAQAFLAKVAGDTKVWFSPPRVPPAEIQKLKDELRPGDILLERRKFYVSNGNGFLPGFWPHAVLYVGTADELVQRGLANRPWIVKHLAEYRRPAHDGNEHRVIEAVAEGVVFSSLEESAGADYVAVLRPRVSEARKDWAIEQAFAHHGKPYDFEFDFFSSDKLVCTELVYRSYGEDYKGEKLHFSLVKMMGRHTYPAVEVVRQFGREWEKDKTLEKRGDSPARELDFVAFLDGPQRRSVMDFIGTAEW